MNKFLIVREDGSEFECETESDLQFLQESHPEWKVTDMAEETPTIVKKVKKALKGG